MPAVVTLTPAQIRLGRAHSLHAGGLSLSAGQRWGLFGGNGSGKTLLSRLLAGRLRESSTYVDYDAGFNPRRHVYLVSFEEQQRLWALDRRRDMSEYSERSEDAGTTVAALVAAGRCAREQQPEQLRSLLEQLQLAQQSGQGIRFLSSGQMRRALIARALYARDGDRPLLLIFDDPLETLDAGSRESIVRLIESSIGESTILLQLCRRRQDLFPFLSHLALMDECRLLACGTVQDLQADVDKIEDHRPTLRGELPRAPHMDADRPASGTPLIKLRSVFARYGDNWLFRGLDWDFHAGEHALISGPNGCGKSTLLGLIDGDNHLAYGQQVELFGIRRGSGETVWEVKARYGCVSNELHNRYVKGWRVQDVIMSGYFDSVGLFDESTPSQQQHGRAWLRYLDLEALAKRYYHELSFGQQRLVLLARAMVKEPEILVLDEACVGLDNGYRDVVMRVLDAIAATTSCSMIYVSHVATDAPAAINRRLIFQRSGDGSEEAPRYQIRQAD